ncbi:5-methylcytosine restriction system specificity protein McrC [Xanthomonas arboricola]|uniref:5-methylcytosine restriction system specificity protein McrC n=1 Tax=Xanthomonas arboricola TaxID=56448 RepID=UPI0007EDA271|nr:hypothetical protein [Xanthomonas arboricola]NIK33690.1 5-methylcytosine-specific restriction endonuclease McrBC regulatory subunit McrC [Xanthomonas arboricola]NJB80550.1 5-methylcytosine-specific restriction endonuclease McrBC regulatory subunit McrC [Xanthomonas arboricola]OBR75394.1 hypothetical protein A7D01_10235 [Xanthomonas arboricola]PPT43058.1 hypothetical protein XarbCFBP8132_06800 [Xanthomonas arboricola]PPT68972.1 hypothetical protein XarbCFBP8142_10710 [Xanthomonas arboricola]
MEKLFETYVAKHFKKQLTAHLVLGTQVRRHHLVRHGDAQWFQLRRDMVISRQGIGEAARYEQADLIRTS